MGDIFPFGKKPSPWQRKPDKPARLQRDWPPRYAATGRAMTSRNLGLIALAIAVAGAIHYSGILQGVIAPEQPRVARDNSAEVKDGKRTIRYATGAAYNAVDGDSLRTNREDIRLLGIDAPELSQTCRDARGGQWACGREAHAKLKALVSRGDVRCTATGRDRFKRSLAVCSAGAVADLGEVMVRDGLAVDFMNGRYARAEADARRARRGIWAGQFEQPQEWRRRNPRGADRS